MAGRERDADPSGRSGALRLTFGYDESGITVMDRTPVDRPVPPHAVEPAWFGAADPSDSARLPAHAVVAELRATDGTTTYRQVVEHAIPHDQEVFDPSIERGMRRHAVPPSSGVFTVIVPNDSAADSVVLLAESHSTGAARALALGKGRPAAGPVEIARFPLRAEKR